MFSDGIAKLHTKINSGELSAAELLSHSHERITAHNDSLNAFVEVYDRPVQSSDSQNDSVLNGIPMGMKDNILIKGKLATAGSHILDGYVASYDSFVTRQLRDAGAVIVGRTNMDEFAMGSSGETSYYGPARNPIDQARVPGGSSSGSAAAVAAGMVAYTLGSDTGGSIRQPAAYCGLVGLKPSYGAVSRNGLIALGSSLDVIGPLTHSVDDARVIFNTIAKYDSEDSTSVPEPIRQEYRNKHKKTGRIGVPRSFIEQEGLDPEVKRAFDQGLNMMQDKGYEIVDIEIPYIESSLAVYYIIQPAEASSNLARFDGIRYGLRKTGDNLSDLYYQTKSEGFGKEVKRRIMLGTHVLSSGYHDAYYEKAQAIREILRQEVTSVFSEVDIIATPTTPSVAFKIGAKLDPVSMYLEDIFTVPYNLTGHPAISVPMGKNSDGLPMGIHFAGPHFCEDLLLDISEDFEHGILNG